jgi:hypothetical protein
VLLLTRDVVIEFGVYRTDVPIRSRISTTFSLAMHVLIVPFQLVRRPSSLLTAVSSRMPSSKRHSFVLLWTAQIAIDSKAWPALVTIDRLVGKMLQEFPAMMNDGGSAGAKC